MLTVATTRVRCKPLVVERQLNHVPNIKFGVPVESSRTIGFPDNKFAAVHVVYTLGSSISNLDIDDAVFENVHLGDERWTILRAGLLEGLLRKTTLNNVSWLRCEPVSPRQNSDSDVIGFRRRAGACL